MSFRDNLQHLRGTRNMTQEQLAMLVGVSRQSVTKWEAEKAYPEMDKLLKICQIFDCTLDELVQGDLTTRAEDPSLTIVPGAPQDICGYDDHMRTFAKRIAAGVASIICGVGLGLIGDVTIGRAMGIQEGMLTAIVLFVGLIIGLALIIPAGVGHSTFEREHPYIQDFYTSDERTRTMRSGAYGIVAGIALIFIGIIVVVVTQAEASAGALLVLIAAGVGLIVYSGIMMSRVNVSEYNDSALAELSDEQAAAVLDSLDENEAANRLAKRKVNQRIGTACGVIMLVATVIALMILFGSMYGIGNFGAGEVQYFWVPWPIGGICCAIVSLILSQVGSKR